MKLSAPFLKALVRVLRQTRSDEIACDECFAQLDRFAEETLVGRDPAEAMPLVAEHLAFCPCCHVEFEALLEALQELHETAPPRGLFARLRRQTS